MLIEFGSTTLAAIDRIASALKYDRAAFIREAVKDAIFQHEQVQMREAFKLNPDSDESLNEWDDPEDWNE